MYRLRRFNKKSPVSPKPPYILFNPHSERPCVAAVDGLIYITVIDPGTVNCCIRCSSYNPTNGMSKTLTQCLINFTSSSTPDGTTFYYDVSLKLLEPFIPYFINSHYIGIESQLSINYDMVRMGQHLTTYIMCNVRNKGHRPLILELDSHLKTRLLNAPPKMTKPQRKKWAHEIGIKFLEASGEINVANMLRGCSKGDDHGDTICYEKVIILILLGRLHTVALPAPRV